MTDQPKWTPGPWVISTATQGYAAACTVHGVERQPTEDGLGKTWVYIRPETLIRDGELHWPDEQEQLANARLIAAAPNMAGVSPRAAEMLRVAATFLRSEEPNGTVFYDGAACDAFCIADDCEAAADDIDAALAKARGQA